MRQVMRLVLCVLAACAAVHTVKAQTQAFIPPTPGTTVYYSDGSYLEADSVNGTVVRIVNSALVQRDLLAACFIPLPHGNYDATTVDSLWPLTPNKSVTVELAQGERRWSLLIKVEGLRQIRTQAGMFNAWVITVDDTAVTHAFRGVSRCWYVPEIGLPVRRMQEITAGHGGAFDVQAVRIEKRDRSQVAEFRPPARGTGFNTTAGFFRVDRVVGTSLAREFENPNNNTYWLGSFFGYTLPVSTVESLSSDVDQLWPLQVGKTISFQHDLPGYYPGSPLYAYHFDVRVERAELVTVPAGTFSTFVVAWRYRGLGNNQFDGTQRFWFSPALGFPIKRQVSVAAGITNWTNYELLNVQRPPQ